MIDIIKAVILGIVEGITEWLPISSTGHMILVDQVIKLSLSKEFKEMFFVVIQFGAILAVILIYFKRLFPFDIKEKKIKKEIFELWFKVLIASIPAAIIGLKYNDYLDEKFYNSITVALMLIIYGVLFIVIENLQKGKEFKIKTIKQLTFKTSFIIGIFQVLALIPGTSRSGATIIGAMLLGTTRKIAAEFTFFLAIPIMFGASLLKLVKFGFSYSGIEIAVLLTGLLTSFFVSIFAIRFLMKYIQKHDFKFFGYYRIVLGIVVLVVYIITK